VARYLALENKGLRPATAIELRQAEPAPEVVCWEVSIRENVMADAFGFGDDLGPAKIIQV